MITIRTELPPRARDYRLDVLRGFANWAIYLDHIPNNVMNWLTQRNYGFSDAADLFVFISGYTASFVYARIMLEREFVIGGTRLVRRAWQIYVAHIVLFVMYIADIGYLAHRYAAARICERIQRRRLHGRPGGDPYQGLIVAFEPVIMTAPPSDACRRDADSQWAGVRGRPRRPDLRFRRGRREHSLAIERGAIHGWWHCHLSRRGTTAPRRGFRNEVTDVAGRRPAKPHSRVRFALTDVGPSVH